MKRLGLFVLFSIIGISLYAQHKYTFSFKLTDFKFEMKDSLLSVNTSKAGAYFSDEEKAPALPYYSYTLLRPSGSDQTDYKVSLKKKLLYKNVSLERNPVIVATNSKFQNTRTQSATKSIFSPIRIYRHQSEGDFNLALFSITPFSYDAESGNLYFVSELTITFPENNKTYKKKTYDQNLKNKIRGLVSNPDEMEKFYPDNNSKETTKSAKSQTSEHTLYNGTIDYVIVTSEALKSSFQTLVNWKIRKGLRAKVVSINEILNCYTDTVMTDQEKIKYWLYSRYYYDGMKWALLGGDTEHVPAQSCPVKVNLSGEIKTDTVPTDLYYPCCGALAPTWDYNGNGIIGEFDDHVSMYPSYYLTRIPVRTASEVTCFTNKLIRYERMNYTDSLSFINKMLFAGTEFEEENMGVNNSYIHAIPAYNTYIQPYWNGTTNYLFRIGSTTYTNLSSNNTLTPSNLSALFVNGYHYFHMDCHGDTNSWLLQSYQWYTYNDAKFLSNANAPIVVTTSCNVNAFDRDNCLSEGFLNFNHGAISFYGSSRYGFYYRNSDAIGQSLLYDSYFFQSLLTGEPSDAPYHFGAVAAHSKMLLSSNAGMNETDGFRYLQFSINPMGDPEMPIYTNTPERFSSVQMTGSGSSVTVSTGGVTGCRIALTSIDGGISYFDVAEDVSSYTFTDVVSPFYVTITKHNYIPYVSDALSLDYEIVGDALIYGSNVFSVNCPTGASVSWQLTSNPNVSIAQNAPYYNQCTVTCPIGSYFKGQLTATIHYGHLTYTKSKSISTAGDFHGTMVQQGQPSSGSNPYPNMSLSYIDGGHFGAFEICDITLSSDDYTAATFTIEGYAPSVWNNNYDGTISVKFPKITGSSTQTSTITGYNPLTHKVFKFHMHIMPESVLNSLQATLNIAASGDTYTISLIKTDADRGVVLQPAEWILSIYRADSGTLVFNEKGTSESIDINTSGWKPGVYIVRGSVDGESTMQKISVR